MPDGIVLPRGHELSHNRQKIKPRVLAEVLEALIGAIFRMKGYNSAKEKIQWMNKQTD